MFLPVRAETSQTSISYCFPSSIAFTFKGLSHSTKSILVPTSTAMELADWFSRNSCNQLLIFCRL